MKERIAELELMVWEREGEIGYMEATKRNAEITFWATVDNMHKQTEEQEEMQMSWRLLLLLLNYAEEEEERTYALSDLLRVPNASPIAVAPSSPILLKLRSRTASGVSHFNSSAIWLAPSIVMRLLQQQTGIAEPGLCPADKCGALWPCSEKMWFP